MSTFGYRNELKKYESVDEDELLAGLSFEEIQELERELADIDPDDNVPIGLRQKDQTAKTPTTTFSREALLKYWEDGTRKLLEDDRSESSFKQDNMEGQTDVAEYEDNNEESQNGMERSKDKSGVEENGSTKEGEEKRDKCKQESSSTSATYKLNVVDHLPAINPGNDFKKGDLKTTTTDQKQNMTPDRPCGNPTVIDEALDQILRDDPTMSELNLNNIEDISQETLLRFSEALCANTHVRIFSLSNTRADDRVAFAVSKMLRENSSITNLNINSNFVSGRGILALLASLQQNSTLVELRFHNQRHICGGQVEMEMVRLLRDNTTLLKLGYQFDLPGPRMTATNILTRNLDQQRQRRLQKQRKQVHPEATVHTQADSGPNGLVSVSPPSNKSTCSSTKHKRKDPPPTTPTLLLGLESDRNTPTRKIAEMIKQNEGSTKCQSGQKKPKSKRGKNGANKESSDILNELKNALKPSSRKTKDNSSCPLAPQRSTRDDLMAAIRGSSIRSLKRVNLQ